MEYRLFGRTGVRVSELALGAMMFGGRTTASDSADIIDRALEHGVNLIDTANSYNQGKSEEAVGAALKRNGRRQSVIVATKVHGQMGEDLNNQGISRRHIISQVEESLRRLDTDYIDLYQLHRPHSDTPIDETLRAMDDLVRSGKVRYIGTSTFPAWEVVQGIYVARDLRTARFVSEQPPYNLLDRRIERELIPVAQTFGLAVIPWGPIGQGLLTGKYLRGQEPPADSRIATATHPAYKERSTQGIYDVIEPLQELANRKGVALSQMALAWVLQRPGITSAIVGPRTMEQLEDNLNALDVTFTEDELAEIDQISPPGTNASRFYETDFAAPMFRQL